MQKVFCDTGFPIPASFSSGLASSEIRNTAEVSWPLASLLICKKLLSVDPAMAWLPFSCQVKRTGLVLEVGQQFQRFLLVAGNSLLLEASWLKVLQQYQKRSWFSQQTVCL